MIFRFEEARDAAERRKKTLLTVYIVVAIAFVAAVLLLLFLSTDHYTPFMIGDILISIAFGFYSIWFFTVQFDCAVKRYRFLNKVVNALQEREYGVFLREEDEMTIDGVEMRILLFDVFGAERELHLFESDFSLEKDRKYILVMRGSVLVEIGECDE